MGVDRGSRGRVEPRTDGAPGVPATHGRASTATDPLGAARLRAREIHAAALARTGGDRTAAALVAAAATERGLAVGSAPGTRPPPGERELAIAHHDLYGGAVASKCVAGTASDGPGPVAPMAGHPPRHLWEGTAEAYAAELLCPTDRLRADLPVGLDRARIADELGLPVELVTCQALRALLLPRPRPGSTPPRRGMGLDASQRRAATWDAGPLFVEAGPGTGKTATLVGRVAHLLEAGASVDSVLVLTFSRSTAEELRGRIASAVPEAAGSMWIGTLHSFGLEVLRASHARAGLPPSPRVLDRDGGLSLLERRLGEMPLRHHRDPHDPAVGLAPVLRVIERCKDAMVSPDQYAAAAREAAAEGDGPAAEAVLEVASIYRAYQDALDEEGALDLGDLVMRATALLEGHDDVAAHWGRRFRHVLVDEYQDMNVAGVRLLSSLCGPGTVPWVVGDARQSIHRFRGAYPDAAATFVEAFGGATVSLDRNYRSRSEVVRAFAAFSSTMLGGACSWEAHRGPGGDVRVSSAPSLAGEATAIRDRIAALHAAGIPHADQAVIARTHLCLDRVGAELERLGVPVLHVGDPFRRPEVRDLLAVLAVADGDLVALVRAATLPPYSVPRSDAVAAVRWAASRGSTVATLLRRAGEVPGMSDASIAGFARLGDFLGRLCARATAVSILEAFLLDERGGPASLAAAHSGRARMGLVAVHLLLGFAAQDAGDAGSVLSRVRRIVALGEGRGYGIVPPEGDDGASVRLLTIHAAKGLEFGAVHVAMATARHLPSARRPDACPPPPDLAHLAMSPADHDAEERALAFVALSRARDHLSLSHARRYDDGCVVRPSPYLARIGPVEASLYLDPPGPTSAAGGRGHGPARGDAPRSYGERDLRGYRACPARYRYHLVDGLAPATPPSAHGRLRRAVGEAVERLERLAAATDGAVGAAEVEGCLDSAWAVHGPVGHRLEAFHRAIARRAVANLARSIAGEAGAAHHRETWEVDVGPGLVAVRPDRIVEHPWGEVVVQVIELARPVGRPSPGALDALLAIGARSRFPHHRIVVERFGAEENERSPVDVPDADDLVTPYADAILGIADRRFPARPGPRCARCPYHHVCGT